MLTESVQVRLSIAEREAVAEIAAADGRSLSNWIRRAILAELAREGERRLRRSRSIRQQPKDVQEERL